MFLSKHKTRFYSKMYVLNKQRVGACARITKVEDWQRCLNTPVHHGTSPVSAAAAVTPSRWRPVLPDAIVAAVGSQEVPVSDDDDSIRTSSASWTCCESTVWARHSDSCASSVASTMLSQNCAEFFEL